MLKRLMMVMIAIGLLALLWPAASAQAASCTGWEQDRDPNNPSRWCYWCPTGYTQVDGDWVECGYCAAWWGGSNIMKMEATQLDSNKCKQDGNYKDCGLAIGVISGTEPIGSQTQDDCDDPYGGCGMLTLIACCPKGHWDPDQCTWPGGGGQGWPQLKEGILVSADGFEATKKKNPRIFLSLDFEEDLCPSKNMEPTAVVIKFNGWSCLFPNGYDWRLETGQYEACKRWNSTRDMCVEYWDEGGANPNNENIPSLTALYCTPPEDLATYFEPGDVIGYGPEGEGGPFQGECVNSQIDPGTGDEITHERSGEICNEFLNNLPESELPWVYVPPS